MTTRATEAGARADALFDGRTWQAMPKSERQRYIERSQRHHDALKAEGFVVVPVEPSTKMICAALDDYDKRGRGKQSYCDIYAAMLAAAAQAPFNASEDGPAMSRGPA